MSENKKELAGELQRHGISRRTFLKFCTSMASAMALTPAAAAEMAEKLAAVRRQSVIWLSFQECTGCTESITRAHKPSLESLIFDFVSLDYHHTLQAASGHAAEEAREKAMHENGGQYIVIVDGSIPIKDDGVYSTIAGITNLDMLKQVAEDAAAIVSVGSCAAYGGLPKAAPNPTGAVAVSDIIKDKPIINIPGCPPMPVVMTGVLAHVLTFGIPELDSLGRPLSFFGDSIHDRCYRRPFYDRGEFAKSFDDEGARKGWCLYELGCKGPITHNACATIKWNNGTSFPIQSGHGCIGCSEPDFWDAGGFYKALSTGTANPGGWATAALVAGAAAGVGSALINKGVKAQASKEHKTVTIQDMGAKDE
ncbi:MAG: hydrogenase small subunit [Gammaproteobacteria bacterium]|nr:hydrogenase small subunit [Gammaproteobacteria bacterium]